VVRALGYPVASVQTACRSAVCTVLRPKSGLRILALLVWPTPSSVTCFHLSSLAGCKEDEGGECSQFIL
jgi:hypothetical protein